MRSRITLSRLALSAALTLLASTQALSQGFWQQLSGIADIDGRRQDMERRINEGIAAGRLNQAQSEPLKAELKRISDLETQYKADGKLSVWETVRLTYQLDLLSQQIETHMGERTVALTDIDGRQAQLDRQIKDATTAGRLTASEADKFKSDLDAIAAKKEAFKADGALTSTEQLTISLDLDLLAGKIEQTMHQRTITNPDIEAKKADTEKRISDALAAGRIGSGEAADFRQELARINTVEANYRASGSTLTTEEKLLLAIDLEKLNARIDRYFPPAPSTLPGIDAKQEEIARKILEAQGSGKISTATAAELKQEFDRIATLESGYRADGSLSDNETLSLARDLDALAARLDSAAAAAPGTGIAERQSAFLRKLNDAVSAGRLSAQAAGDLRQEADRIAARTAFFRADGLLSDSETLALASEWTQAEAKLDQSLSPLPDLTGRQARLEARINESVGSGRLQPSQADVLRADLRRIASLESTFKSSEGRLDDQEVITLAREFDALFSRVEASLASLPDIGALKAKIEAKLAGAATLTPAQKDDFKAESGRITSVESSFRASEGGLNDWETVTLGRDLDRLSQAIDRALAAAPPAVSTATAVPPIEGPVAPDTRGHWAEPYVAALSGRNVIGGFPDGSFRPNDEITRAQFAAIAVKALNIAPASAGRHFTDVPEKHWAARAIAAVSNAGLVGGFPDGSFKPEDKITRAQALVILSKALPRKADDPNALRAYADAASVPSWAEGSVAAAARDRIIVNYPDPALIRPNNLATRAEVASLMYQTMSQLGASLPPLRIGVLSLPR